MIVNWLQIDLGVEELERLSVAVADPLSDFCLCLQLNVFSAFVMILIALYAA